MAKTVTYERPFLRQLHITNLKGLKNISIDFMDEDGRKQWVTGIFGKNGSGKTTILQTILCLYRPIKEDGAENRTKMSRFFKNVREVNWIGSCYDATFEHLIITKEDNKVVDSQKGFKIVPYSKNGEEWRPISTKRFRRAIYYVPISTCIPVVEEIGVNTTQVTYDYNNAKDLNELIVKYASQITGFQYKTVQSVNTWGKKSFVVQKNINGEDVQCHSFAMGAGEQRIFRLLEKVINAPKYSLIVIDEIDLTLHTDAIKKLIKCLYEIAKVKETQIVFSSHRQELMDLNEVNTFFLLHTDEGITCLHNPTSDCYEELTGETKHDLHIFVEDEVSKTIVEHELLKKGIFTRTKVKRFGAAINGFAIAAGIVSSVHEEVLQDASISWEHKDLETQKRLTKYLILLDGDKYVTTEEKKERIKKALTGDDDNAIKRRNWMLGIIKQYKSIQSPLDANKMASPDCMLHEMLIQLFSENDFGNDESIIREAHKIGVVLDEHDYTTELLKKGIDLNNIVNAAMRSKTWTTFMAELTDWINTHIEY